MSSGVSVELLDEFRKTQEMLKTKLRLPSEGGGLQLEDVRYVGALDISFTQTQPDKIGYAALAVFRYSDLLQSRADQKSATTAATVVGTTNKKKGVNYGGLKPAYLCVEKVELTIPYVPGFLAFRELPHLIPLLEKLKVDRPEVYPQVLLVDGNGILHCSEFGCACHLGVLTGLATIGVGKTFFNVDGLTEDIMLERYKTACRKKGDTLPIEGKSGKIWGVVLKNTPEYPSKNCLYISVGHDIHIDVATQIVQQCLKSSEPEPIRSADLAGREAARKFDASATK
jgi:deoxyinosine 3'endonuclease (endonuclease V)